MRQRIDTCINEMMNTLFCTCSDECLIAIYTNTSSGANSCDKHIISFLFAKRYHPKQSVFQKI